MDCRMHNLFSGALFITSPVTAQRSSVVLVNLTSFGRGAEGENSGGEGGEKRRGGGGNWEGVGKNGGCGHVAARHGGEGAVNARAVVQVRMEKVMKVQSLRVQVVQVVQVKVVQVLVLQVQERKCMCRKFWWCRWRMVDLGQSDSSPFTSVNGPRKPNCWTDTN